jgi:uncharacterized protein
MERSEAEEIVVATRTWLDKAVIGLNLCPFAKPIRDRIRYAVSEADTPDELRADLVDELQTLAAADPDEIEATLLIHPRVLADFLDYNDFLEVADETLEDLDLVGEIQIASFHPRYQFAGTEPDDIENYTNRSPHPHAPPAARIERRGRGGSAPGYRADQREERRDHARPRP